MAGIDKYLQILVHGMGSDLHMSASRKPVVRVHGTICQLDDAPVYSSDEVLAYIKEIIPEKNFIELTTEWDTDCAYEIPGLARFRFNGFRDMNGYGCVMRTIPEDIPSFEDLRLPGVLRDFCDLSKGLVVVTGPTGSGKSTTLAAMIDYINTRRREHIITIEDPIEFVHTPKNCQINQREVFRHTESFARALRAALREDPDVVLVGEMRDLETMETAIETAETGHLVFATLHTNNASTTVERIIDKFPASRQNQIRSMLADTLRGVVAQTLCKRQDSDGRIAAFEVLVVNTSVAALIREAKTHMLPSVIQTGRNLGMQTFADELTNLATKGIISAEEAYTKAIDKSEIETKFALSGISLDFKAKAAEEARLRGLNRAREVFDQIKSTYEQDQKNHELQVTYAWILATSPYEELRNGKLALRLAEQASRVFRDKNPEYLVVLAAALAENRSFKKALDILRRASDLYVTNGDTVRAANLKHQQNLYEKGKAFRDE
jgi:twitching motility protein PilT